MHVLRIGLYSLLAPSWIFALWFMVLTGLVLGVREDLAIRMTPYALVGMVPVGWQPLMMLASAFSLTVVVGVWSLFWWVAACRLYLRLERCALVVGIAGFLTFLFVLSIQIMLAIGL